MKKSAIVLFFALLSHSVFAQSVQEGVNHLYAERYQSAKSVFDKLVAANPNNIEANYWLGQTLIKTKDTAAAVAQFQKLIAANGNAPLALVGIGQVELMQGKTAEARQRFETAISLSKGKKGNDPNILLAVGRANTDAKAGDIAYAIQKLNEATQLAPTNAEVFLALGNAHRKIPGNGSQAATAYLKAASANPAFPMPNYRLAMLYKTQVTNYDAVLENLNKSVAADPKFAPAYYELYYHYLYQKDFPKAEDFAKKYLSNTDPSVNNEYITAQTAFVQDKFDEAIATGKNIIAQAGDKANPKVYKLLGYSYIGKGDSVTARQYVDQYFAKEDPENFVGQDYILQADAYASNNPGVVKEAYLKAAKMDSVLGNQIKFLNAGIDRFKKSGHRLAEADLRLLSYQLRGSQAGPAELFQIGIPYYQGRAFERADSVFTAYATALPDSIYGWYWSGLTRHQMDTTLEKGLAVEPYKKTLEIAEKDKARLKSQGVAASIYLAGYSNNIQKDKEAAISYVKRGLELDPANATLLSINRALTAPTRSTPSRSQTQTSTSANSAKDGDTKVKKDSAGTVKKVKAN
jgi:tetratricopeptide (TPR) repeat protein